MKCNYIETQLRTHAISLKKMGSRHSYLYHLGPKEKSGLVSHTDSIGVVWAVRHV